MCTSGHRDACGERAGSGGGYLRGSPARFEPRRTREVRATQFRDQSLRGALAPDAVND
jgi:hypothetical protein